MEDITQITVFDIKEEPILGLAESYARLASAGVPANSIQEALRQEVKLQDLPMPGGRGDNTVFSWLAERFRSRKLVQDLGVHPAQVEWFVLHVPPGGSAKFSIENKLGMEAGCSLKIVGLGGGAGKKYSFSLKYASPERKYCTRFIQHLDLRVKLFEVKSGDKTIYETLTDVANFRHQEVLPWKGCPYCGIAADAIDPFQYEVDSQGIDLRQDEVGQIQTHSLDIENTRSFELTIPIQVPVISKALDAGISVKRGENWHCEVSWTFPPGKFSVAYWLYDASRELPFWSFR